MVPTHRILRINYSQERTGFGTAQLGLIFKLNQRFQKGKLGKKSLMVDLSGLELLTSLSCLSKFFIYGPRQNRTAAPTLQM
jgi:hypothetical protein